MPEAELRDGMDTRAFRLNDCSIRAFRLKLIVEHIKKNPGITKEDLLKYLMVDLGARRIKAKEYMDLLEEFAMIYRKGDKYYAKKT